MGTGRGSALCTAGSYALPPPADALPTPPTPALDTALTRAFRLHDHPSAALLPSEPPTVAKPPPVTTPLSHDSLHSSYMNLLVGGALPPMRSPHPPRRLPLREPNPALRLPSFEAMGIAAPHPDRFGVLGLYGPDSDLIRSTLSYLPTDGCIDSAGLATFTSRRGKHLVLPKPFIDGRQIVAPVVRHDAAALTPPADNGDIIFSTVASVSAAPVDSASMAPSADSRPSDAVQQGGEDPASLSTSLQRPSISPPRLWIDTALNVLLENLRTAAQPINPLRVLSHALPSPSPTGHVFRTMIEAIHETTPTQPTVWINVFHAIQGRFNLADLPSSPPSTPGPAIGGDDYFTQKVFDTAVSIADYQEDLSALPRSPRPVVPPSSINVSIVERYIPPTNSHEFKELFSTNGPSLLVDRLVELSPNHGNLVFIYPTRAGAQTFMREYLGPILDPALRSTVVINGLSSNLSQALGKMVAADELPLYGAMHRSVVALCGQLTQRSSSMQRFHGRRATFKLVHASKEEVYVGREAWANDWWAKQEKPRIRESMTRYAQEAQRQSSNEYVERAPTPTELVQQLLDHVTKRPYAEGEEPKQGIEVAVFVIERTD